jgi:glutaredoxin
VAVKLHRCRNLWAKLGGHPCWKVQRELDQAGVDYVVVPGPVRRSKRDTLEQLSGQRQYPVIEFEDGSVYREESKNMAETIKSGRLMEKRGAAVPAAHGHDHDDHGHDHHEHEHEGPPA